MANTKSDRNQKRIDALDIFAKKLLSTVDPGYVERETLNAQDARVQRILTDELDFSKGVSNGSIVDFIATTAIKKGSGKSQDTTDPSEIFTKELGELYQYYQDSYKNRFMEISDLKFITKFIPGIGEAVRTTLDDIVSANDISTSITRNLVLPSNLTDNEQSQVLQEIHRIEEQEKLLKRLKNIAYRKTLISGNYYIYHIPYSELFAEYDRRKAAGKLDNSRSLKDKNPQIAQITSRSSREGFNMNSGATESLDITLDSCISDCIDSMTYIDKSEGKTLKKTLIDSGELCDIRFDDTYYLGEAIEGVEDLSQIGNDSGISPSYAAFYRGTGATSIDNYSGKYSNEVVDTEGSYDPKKSTHRHRVGRYNLPGTYIKFIDPKNMLPIRVHNQTAGYLHIHNLETARTATKPKSKPVNNINGTNTIFSSVNLSEKKKDKVMQDIANTIAENVLSNFSTKFVTKYAEHKKLIADCLIANGLVNQEYAIQFIPAQYVTEFVINEDEEGNGVSMLTDSLFPAKMLLSLVINKLLNYMNNSGTKTYAYVGKGPVDVGTANHAQRVIRMLQEGDIVFNDLLATNLIFSKFARNSHLQMPKTRNGEKLIELEVQEGQDINMRPEMEEWLEKLAILGTGVPSSIMDYTDTADFSRSLVMANLKHAARVASYQSDLEEATTDLYKALIIGSNLPEDVKLKTINGFQFKLARPRILSNANISDFIGTLQQSAQTMTDILLPMPENTDDMDKDYPLVRQEFLKNYVLKNAPFINKDEVELDIHRAQITVKSKSDLDKAKSNDMDGSDGNMDL